MSACLRGVCFVLFCFMRAHPWNLVSSMYHGSAHQGAKPAPPPVRRKARWLLRHVRGGAYCRRGRGGCPLRRTPGSLAGGFDPWAVRRSGRSGGGLLQGDAGGREGRSGQQQAGWRRTRSRRGDAGGLAEEKAWPRERGREEEKASLRGRGRAEDPPAS